MTGDRLGANVSLRAALEIVARDLAEAGLEEPRREARLLLGAALGLDHAGLILGESRLLGADFPRLADILARRCTREPLSRILGRREFYGLDFSLGTDTLDPRPDTETLIDAVLHALGLADRLTEALSILDLGTGTGAVLLALLAKLPNATGLGVDIAPGAVAIAGLNAARLGLADRCRFETGDLYGNLPGRYTIIVSNPPYIPTGDIATLDPEVRLHDPLAALDGGVDGLDFYRRIVAGAPERLSPHGVLALEVGAGQAEAVAALVIKAGFARPDIIPDLAGIARVVLAHR